MKLSYIQDIQRPVTYPAVFKLASPPKEVPSNPKIAYKFRITDKENQLVQVLISASFAKKVAEIESLKKLFEDSPTKQVRDRVARLNTLHAEEEIATYFQLLKLPGQTIAPSKKKRDKKDNKKQETVIVMTSLDQFDFLVRPLTREIPLPLFQMSLDRLNGILKEEEQKNLKKLNQVDLKQMEEEEEKEEPVIALVDEEDLLQNSDEVQPIPAPPPKKEQPPARPPPPPRLAPVEETKFSERLLKNIMGSQEDESKSLKRHLSQENLEFLKVSDLKPEWKGDQQRRINLMGVIHQIGKRSYHHKTNKNRVNLEVVDPLSRKSILLCIWEWADINPERSVLPGLQIGLSLLGLSFRISTFGEYTLNFNNESEVYFENNLPDRFSRHINDLMKLRAAYCQGKLEFMCMSKISERMEQLFEISLNYVAPAEMVDVDAPAKMDSASFTKDLSRSIKQSFFGKKRFQNLSRRSTQFAEIRLISDISDFLQVDIPIHQYICEKQRREPELKHQSTQSYKFYVFAYLDSINFQEYSNVPQLAAHDRSCRNDVTLAPPIYKMCPTPGCKKNLFEKKYFNMQQMSDISGDKVNPEDYGKRRFFQCAKCAKVFQNYIPKYNFMAELADPASSSTITVKFFDEGGRILLKNPPEVFEKTMDFKERFLNDQNASTGVDKLKLEKQLAEMKAHQNYLFEQRFFKPFLLLVRGEYFNTRNTYGKTANKLQFVCENIIDLGTVRPQQGKPVSYYLDKVNLFFISMLEQYKILVGETKHQLKEKEEEKWKDIDRQTSWFTKTGSSLWQAAQQKSQEDEGAFHYFSQEDGAFDYFTDEEQEEVEKTPDLQAEMEEVMSD